MVDFPFGEFNIEAYDTEEKKIFDSNRFIFPHDVDYFGRIVGLANDYPWMKKNAIHDLLNTEHERAYLYLAADFFKNHLAISKNESPPILSVKEYKNFFTESVYNH